MRKGTVLIAFCFVLLFSACNTINKKKYEKVYRAAKIVKEYPFEAADNDIGRPIQDRDVAKRIQDLRDECAAVDSSSHSLDETKMLSDFKIGADELRFARFRHYASLQDPYDREMDSDAKKEWSSAMDQINRACKWYEKGKIPENEK
jgi:hypothetical protein